MIKRVLYILLAFVLLLAGCSTEPNSPAATASSSDKEALVGDIPIAFPLVDKPESLNIMSVGIGGKEQEDVYVWQKYEQMTGVDINWTTVTKETRSEAYHTALTNSQQYDLIMRCKLSATKLLSYGRSGLILDLAKDGLLQNNAPNCWAYLQEHPDALASVMNPDGTIYALPQVNSGAELRVATKFFVNKLWLERVNMSLPTSTEEFKALLLAFNNYDANGNGDKNDEIPFCTDWSSVKTALYGAFGLSNRGIHNEIFDSDGQGGVRFIESSEPYRDFLEYTHDLYAQDLIDKNTFSLTTNQLIGNIAADRVGVFASTNLALLPADKADNYVAIEEALTGPNGDKLWSGIRANFHSTGAAVIPATCKDPGLVLSWLDYFWTDEGTLFYHMGVEGETYTKLIDGTYDYMPKMYDEMNEKNLSFDVAVGEYSPYPGGSNPTVEIAPYFMGGEMADIPAAAARALMAYGPEEYWPSFTFTQEENDILDSVYVDINKYCQSMAIDFITGARPFEEWDAYVTELDRLGVAKMLHVYKAAVDRYHALTTALN